MLYHTGIYSTRNPSPAAVFYALKTLFSPARTCCLSRRFCFVFRFSFFACFRLFLSFFFFLFSLVFVCWVLSGLHAPPRVRLLPHRRQHGRRVSRLAGAMHTKHTGQKKNEDRQHITLLYLAYRQEAVNSLMQVRTINTTSGNRESACRKKLYE